MRLAVGKACQEGVELGAREGPVEGLGDLSVLRFESRDARGESVEVSDALGSRTLRWMTEK